jgi:hypothetical protein
LHHVHNLRPWPMLDSCQVDACKSRFTSQAYIRGDSSVARYASLAGPCRTMTFVSYQNPMISWRASDSLAFLL